MENLFDIDLNDLANSESGIITEKTGFTPASTEPTDDKSKGKEKDDLIDKDAITFEDIANLDIIDKIKDDESDPNKTKTPAEKKNANASSSSQDSALPSLALVLKDAGVFSSISDEDLKEIKSVDDIVKAVEKQIKTNELADLDDEDKEYLEARRKGLSHTEIIQSKAVTEQYKNITDKVIEDKPEIQYELIRRSFLIKGFDEVKAKKYTETIMEGEDALEEALEAKKALIDHEDTSFKDKLKEKQEAFDNKLKAEQTALDTLKSKVNENYEILPGVKVNSQTKDKIFNSMVTPVKSKDNKLMNEVMDLYGSDPEYKMQLHAIHVITKGFKDFSKFQTSKKSEAVENLEKLLKEQGSMNHGSSGNSNKMGSTGKSIIDAMPDFSKRK